LADNKITNERPWLKVQRDKEYGVGTIDVRFDMPATLSPDMMPIVGAETIKLAIEQWERLGDGHGHHYKFLDSIDIEYFPSPVQHDVEVWRSMPWTELQALTVQSSEPTVACIARLHFQRPLDEVNLDLEAEIQKHIQSGEAEGFVPMEQMPEAFQESRQETEDGG
jgi:hypothetical protein